MVHWARSVPICAVLVVFAVNAQPISSAGAPALPGAQAGLDVHGDGRQARELQQVGCGFRGLPAFLNKAARMTHSAQLMICKVGYAKLCASVCTSSTS